VGRSWRDSQIKIAETHGKREACFREKMSNNRLDFLKLTAARAAALAGGASDQRAFILMFYRDHPDPGLRLKKETIPAGNGEEQCDQY
jgi:hypothetical protein